MRLAILSAANAVHAIRWANELANRGYETHFITLHPEIVGFDVRVIRHQLAPAPPKGYLLSAPELRQCLRALKPDLLHVHYVGGYGVMGLLSGFHPRIQSVWGSDVFAAPYQSPLHRWLTTRSIMSADWVCSTSHVMAEQTRLLCPNLHHLSVTPFGIDTTIFVPNPAADQHNQRPTIHIGTVKTLHAKYGIDTLIRAFAQAQQTIDGDERYRHLQLKLDITGGGELETELRALAVQLGLLDVTFHGFVPHADVPNALRNLDIYVALSREESFGVAILEASACGLPVLVSNIGGLPEVVEDQVTGLIVPVDDVPAAAQAIVRLAVDADLRRRMGEAGRRLVEERYTWSASVSLMESIYAETLNTVSL